MGAIGRTPGLRDTHQRGSRKSPSWCFWKKVLARVTQRRWPPRFCKHGNNGDKSDHLRVAVVGQCVRRGTAANGESAAFLATSAGEDQDRAERGDIEVVRNLRGKKDECGRGDQRARHRYENSLRARSHFRRWLCSLSGGWSFGNRVARRRVIAHARYAGGRLRRCRIGGRERGFQVRRSAESHGGGGAHVRCTFWITT